MLTIYNTLTAKKEPFTPLKGKQVNMYTCGVTVYDKCHIGHGRSLYIFEVIRRYLAFKGFRVKMVRNITDVDDKIINKANQLREKNPALDITAAVNEVTTANTKAYYDDVHKLGLSKADVEPAATGHIPEMIRCIQALIEKGAAYTKAGNVYFRVKEFPAYGKLSKRNPDELIAGARVEVSEEKEDPLDFALWKKAKENEPSWDAPWGRGRPGWHIECSAMSRKYLGDTLDIHGGGKDLIFPHHENEIAQSEVLTGRPFARYWIHHGLITVARQKMAKSLGNFITLEDILQRINSDTLKIFYLSATYHSPLDYSEEIIQEAEKVRKRLMIMEERLAPYQAMDAGSVRNQRLQEITDNLTRAMDDDFNMPLAFSAVFEVIEFVNDYLVKGSRDFGPLSEAKSVFELFKHLFVLSMRHDGVVNLQPIKMGLRAHPPNVVIPPSENEINSLIEKRNTFRKEKRFNDADKIRDDLLRKGIILDDFPDGKTLPRRT